MRRLIAITSRRRLFGKVGAWSASFRESVPLIKLALVPRVAAGAAGGAAASPGGAPAAGGVVAAEEPDPTIFARLEAAACETVATFQVEDLAFRWFDDAEKAARRAARRARLAAAIADKPAEVQVAYGGAAVLLLAVVQAFQSQ